MRIVFIGTPEFALPSLQRLHESQHDVVGIITAPDRKAGRGMKLTESPVKQFAVSHGIPVLQPSNLKDPEFLEQLRNWSADIQVVIAFRMLPEVVWAMPPLGTINLHASLLPDYRGAAPINWAIINGERETGLTTFQLVHEIDHGGILLQQKVPIGPEDTAGTLHDKLMTVGSHLVLETVNGLENGSLESKPQDVSMDYNPAPKIYKDDCLINWHKTGLEIHNFVRGLSPVPAARTVFRNESNGSEFLVKVFQTSVVKAGHDFEPGTLRHANGRLFVSTTDGWVYLEEVQQEGRKRMFAEDFLRGLSADEIRIAGKI